MRRRKREQQAAAAQDETPSPVPVAPEGRPDGPWDRSEKEPSDRHVDLGSLLVRGRVGIELRVPKEGENTPTAVVLLTEDSGLELRAFAAPRSGGLWDDVRPEMAQEVERRDGTYEEVEGPYGTELHVRVPAKTPDGEAGVQPTRIVVVEGPRWMLRATFLGRAALEPSDDGILAETLRDTIVVRGPEPRLAREALPIQAKGLVSPEEAPEDGPGDDGDAAPEASSDDGEPQS
ncbi:DUF3710 domain-containing protein [Aeromicrobium sp. CTD01-1L150]|uniref:DUF3710 domain-containing protein n=1 Tax=Aeromicrobium sp. CTD01-1L150 TaxID=3341830 RepID=UPI0035BEB6DC